MPLTFPIAVIPNGRRCPRLVKAKTSEPPASPCLFRYCRECHTIFGARTHPKETHLHLHLHLRLHLQPTNPSLFLRVQTRVEAITSLETMLLRVQPITSIPLLLLALQIYKPSSRELRTWKKLLSGTFLADADPNLSRIISAHRNALILKAKPLTNTYRPMYSGQNTRSLHRLLLSWYTSDSMGRV